MSELKPCPFCGSPAYSYHDNCIDFAGVKCDLGGCVCADILITENNWNNRPIEDALTARIAELEQQQRWIPVEERLPEDSDWVLGLYNGYRVTSPIYYDVEYGWVRVETPDYWMPLPNPPEVNNE